MSVLSLRAPLPLLVKELAEQAARRRTYVVRVVYALALFAVVLVVFYTGVGWGADPLALLGSGRLLFEALVGAQFVGIALFLPAMMSGVITYEKERRSLELLLLTDLRPRHILAQKYLGRLIPMCTFLLLSLPLLAICYALGGLTADYLCSGIYLLFLACLQVGALSLMCSCYCRTSMAAFVSTYLVAAAVVAGYALVLSWQSWNSAHAVAEMLLPPCLFGVAARSEGAAFTTVVSGSTTAVASTILFLALARLFLIRRAFATPRNVLLSLFRGLDRALASANRKIGGVQLVKDKRTLPGGQPVAWREVTKTSLGKGRYLLRLLVLIEIPVLAVCVLCAGRPGNLRFYSELLSVMIFILWGLAALCVCVLSANAVPSERSRQTLDVLLTTPLKGREILRQKLRGVRRLVLVLLVPFFTLFLMEAWYDTHMSPQYWVSWYYGRTAGLDTAWIYYLVASALAALIYLPALSWVSLWVGARARNRSRAIVAALVVFVLWWGGPLALAYVARSETLGWLVTTVSPAVVIYINEMIPFALLVHNPYGQQSPLVWYAISFLVHLAILLLFFGLCRRRADRYLGRARARRSRASSMGRAVPTELAHGGAA